MTVARLLAALARMPLTADVRYVYDGEARSDVDHVWLSRDGHVVLAQSDEPVYSKESQPSNAVEEDGYWYTPVQNGTRDGA